MLASWQRTLRLYFRLQVLHLQVFMEYEADFWIGIVGAALRHLSGFVFIWALFQRIPQVKGWSMWEIAFLYGLSVIPSGLVEVFYDGQWELRRLINQGEFDRLLLRPLSPALQVITQMSNIHGFGPVILGLIVLIKATFELKLSWSVGHVLFLVATLLSSMLIIGALNYITNCLAFWDQAANASLPVMVQNVLEFAKYPLTLYGRVVQALVTWVLPVTFVSYFPGLVLLNKTPSPLSYAAPLAGLVMTFITGLIWKRSLAAYQGTGS